MEIPKIEEVKTYIEQRKQKEKTDLENKKARALKKIRYTLCNELKKGRSKVNTSHNDLSENDLNDIKLEFTKAGYDVSTGEYRDHRDKFAYIYVSIQV